MAYTKLHASIINSTVWRLPHHIRIVWVTMMAMADQDGTVRSSIPGLSDASRVTLPETKDALACFLSPDEHSATPDDEGRRIEVCPGGWRLLNYDLYRERLSEADRRMNASLRQQRFRAKQQRDSVTRNALVTAVTPVTPRASSVTEVTPVTPEITLAEQTRQEAEKNTHTPSRKVQEQSPADEVLATACVPPKPNGESGFVPDVTRFIDRYPGPVNDLAAQYFCQIVKDAKVQEVLFRNLESWKGSDQWKRGIGIKGAKNWLSEGDWKISPKATLTPAAGSLPPGWQKYLDDEKQENS